MTKSTPRHGHEPIPMRRRESAADTEALGDFAWQEGANGSRRIVLIVPSPDARGWVRLVLPVSREKNPPKWWWWDGNEDTPTMTASLHPIGHWHGWVRNGELVEA